jgi:hypothetical protein
VVGMQTYTALGGRVRGKGCGYAILQCTGRESEGKGLWVCNSTLRREGGWGEKGYGIALVQGPGRESGGKVSRERIIRGPRKGVWGDKGCGNALFQGRGRESGGKRLAGEKQGARSESGEKMWREHGLTGRREGERQQMVAGALSYRARGRE